MKLFYYIFYIPVRFCLRGDFIWNCYLWLHSHSEKTFWFRLVLFWYERKLRSYNSWIGYKARFANKPTFPHGYTGIFISHGATIGKDCVIYHQVTIGSNGLKTSKSYGAPVVGNSVLIGCGAKIIGGGKIGNNVHIGANAVVVQDVPDNATIVPMTRLLEKNNL